MEAIGAATGTIAQASAVAAAIAEASATAGQRGLSNLHVNFIEFRDSHNLTFFKATGGR